MVEVRANREAREAQQCSEPQASLDVWEMLVEGPLARRGCAVRVLCPHWRRQREDRERNDDQDQWSGERDHETGKGKLSANTVSPEYSMRV
jgi:hypothetical protein